MVFEDHASLCQVRDKDLQKPSRNLHVMKILNHKSVVDFIKGFGEVNEGHDHCMMFLLIHSSMDEVEESDEVVGDGGAFQSTTVGRVKVGLDDWKEPVTKKSLVNFAAERSARDISEVVFTFRWMHLGDRGLVFHDPLAGVFTNSCYCVVNNFQRSR